MTTPSAGSFADLLPILAVPLAAGLIVLMTHVPLGEQVLRRGIVFIDLAIAQIAALGAMIAASLLDEPWFVAAAGALTALAGAGLVAALGSRFPAWREAAIGLVYVGAAVIAILWISADPRGAHELAAMLSGDVLWVTWTGLAPLALVSALFLLLKATSGRTWTVERGFYPWFAILVSLSVPLLGLYLVFATLIVPALLRAVRPTLGTAATVAIGSGGYAAGLLVSVAADLPSGPCIVLALIALAVIALAIAGNRHRSRRPALAAAPPARSASSGSESPSDWRPQARRTRSRR